MLGFYRGVRGVCVVCGMCVCVECGLCVCVYMYVVYVCGVCGVC